jgi:hypothetical protein
MATLLVTVAWRGRRRDLAVPADVPIADLLLPIAAAMLGADPHRPHAGPGAMHRPHAGPDGVAGPASGSRWGWPGRASAGGGLALAPLGGAPLPAGRTLAACGVGDGAVLVLLE